MTKQTMSIAGRSDVCSVGGEGPTHDYKLSGALPPGAVGTLRLCHDCHEIRSMAGEPFVEL